MMSRGMTRSNPYRPAMQTQWTVAVDAPGARLAAQSFSDLENSGSKDDRNSM